MTLDHDSEEHRFWAWFVANEEQLFHFERDRERTFDVLSEALGKVSPSLTFEFGPIDNNSREFVASAGGILKAFPAVEALVAAAPSMPRWNVIKFRQRRFPIMTLTFAGRKIDPEQVHFALLWNGTEIGLCLFFDEFSDEDDAVWKQIGFLLLDEALGEYDVEAKIGMLQFCHSSQHADWKRFPLPLLPAMFDDYCNEVIRKH